MTVQFNEGRLEVELRPSISPERMVENIKSALSRGLREVPPCKSNGETLAIAAGGPSLSDTYQLLPSQGHIAAANGSLKFLLDKGIVPEFCGVLDASPHMADVVIADPRVRYLVASNCDPSLFDKLLGSGCRVWLWHPTPGSIGTDEGAKALQDLRPDDWLMIAGGCTIGLRWVNIGYLLGYRSFHLHGLDSSFRDKQTHAYADRRCGAWVDANALEIAGRRTSLNFLQQVTDCAAMLEFFHSPSVEPVRLEVHGDGLLQDCWRFWEDNKETMTPSSAFRMIAEDLPVVRAKEVLARIREGQVRGAEVGVFSGRMSKALLQRKDLTLVMVDSWEGFGSAYTEDGRDWHAELSQERQDRYKAAAIRNTDFASDRRKVIDKRSLCAAEDIEIASLDFVFIDADHSYEACSRDIRAWWPKLKDGGVLCGHDYGHAGFRGVKIAVDEFAASHLTLVEVGADTTWFIRKAKH